MDITLVEEDSLTGQAVDCGRTDERVSETSVRPT